MRKYLFALCLLVPLTPAAAFTTVTTANKYMVENTTGTSPSGTACYDFQTRPTCAAFINGLVISTGTLGPGSTNYIQNTANPTITTQIFNVSSGTVTNSFNASTGTFTTGLVGRTSGVMPPTLDVGFYVSSGTNRVANQQLATGTSLNIGSLTLAPGEWMILWGFGIRPGGATSITAVTGGISTVSATLPSSVLMTPDAAGQVSLAYQLTEVPGSGQDIDYTGFTTIANISSTTPYYLVVNASFSVNTLAVYGSMTAVRIN